MPIKFKAIARKNPRDLTAPEKFYASVASSGHVDVDELSKRVAYASSTNRSDVYAVIMALLDIIPIELAEGNIVRLGKLGSLTVVVNSEGSDTADEVSQANIKSVKVRFMPGKELKGEAQKFPFTKVNT